MARRLLIVFLAAFVLNLLWEKLHSALYVSYQGGTITNLILLRAAAFDAAVIIFFSCPLMLWELNSYSRCRSLTPTALLAFSLFPRGRVGEGVLVLILIVFAVLLEKWALGSGRWAYTDAMPIIPLLNVGLTPAIQLGLLGYASVGISEVFVKKAASCETATLKSDL